MPKVLAVLGVERYEVAIVITDKHNPARCGESAGPHSPASRHGILPGALSCLRVDSTQDNLPSFFRRSTPGKVLHGLRLLRRTAEHAALLERNHVKKPRRRRMTLSPPVRGALY